jgi:hypothetical protein
MSRSIALWCRLVQFSKNAMETMENMGAIDENWGLSGRRNTL